MKALFSFCFMALSSIAFAQNDPLETDQGASNNYVTSTCRWVEDIPRRKPVIPTVELCGAGTPISELCMGYVVCDARNPEGAKFVRMATCSNETCGNNQAAACVAAAGYSSIVPNDENARDSVSERVRRRLGQPRQTLER